MWPLARECGYKSNGLTFQLATISFHIFDRSPFVCDACNSLEPLNSLLTQFMNLFSKRMQTTHGAIQTCRISEKKFILEISSQIQCQILRTSKKVHTSHFHVQRISYQSNICALLGNSYSFGFNFDHRRHALPRITAYFIMQMYVNVETSKTILSLLRILRSKRMNKLTNEKKKLSENIDSQKH